MLIRGHYVFVVNGPLCCQGVSLLSRDRCVLLLLLLLLLLLFCCQAVTMLWRDHSVVGRLHIEALSLCRIFRTPKNNYGNL